MLVPVNVEASRGPQAADADAKIPDEGMGKKVAVVVNGDAEARHLENVERSVDLLQRQGYDVYVLNERCPAGVARAHCFAPTKAGLDKLRKSLEGVAGPDTDLFLYTTGYGGLDDGGSGTLCLLDGCDAPAVIAALDSIRYGRRTVVMDQCYSGNWNKVFLDDPRTLFVSAGSRDETVCCQEIAPRFWSDDVPDANGDGVVSWQERYAHAVGDRPPASQPQFVASEGYRLEGRPPFPGRVVGVEDRRGLERQLERLKPGQYAIITFSAEWCGLCKHYRPLFDRMAAEGGGQHLWLRTENEELAAEWNVPGYPTVAIVDAAGNRALVAPEEREGIPRRLAEFAIPLQDRLAARAEEARRRADPVERTKALALVAQSAASAGMREQTTGLLQEAADAADKIDEPYLRSDMMLGIADIFADLSKESIAPDIPTDLSSRAGVLVEKAVAGAGAIRDAAQRFDILLWAGGIALKLARGSIAGRAIDQAATAAAEIEDAAGRFASLTLVALAFHDTGRPGRYAALMQQSLSTAGRVEDPRKRIDLLCSALSEVIKRHDRDRGAAILEKLDEAVQELPEPVDRATVYANTGWFIGLAGQGQHEEEAERYLNRALVAAASVPDEGERHRLARAINERRDRIPQGEP